ncbi:MAG: hypothetical protein MK078_12540 [Crocinitomicaceae bacterium]|nr:hypothetical protein [Crocinitomicaceae bacterium]
MRDFLKSHTLFSTYSVIFLGLIYGVLVTSGTTYLGYLLTFYGTFLVSYFAFNKVMPKKEIKLKFLSKRPQVSIHWILIPFLVFMVIHLILEGGSPAISAYFSTTPEEAALIRENILQDLPSIFGYISSIAIKAAIPFLLLYLLLKEQKLLYWILFIVASFYAFSLMQKSFIVAILLPALIYALVKRKFFYSIKYIGVIALTIISLTKIANPGKLVPVKDDSIGLNDVVIEVEEEPVVSDAPSGGSVELKPSGTRIGNILYGIQRRVFVVPGEVVSGWFDNVPEKKPFLYGDGYRLLAMLKGNQRRAYSIELYPLLKPQNAQKGLKGTVNAASFMYDYVNFGVYGLIFSGIILSLLFVFVERLFQSNFELKLSLNLYPILILSSSALTTLLFSGGWAFLLLFNFLFLNDDQKTES